MDDSITLAGELVTGTVVSADDMGVAVEFEHNGRKFKVGRGSLQRRCSCSVHTADTTRVPFRHAGRQLLPALCKMSQQLIPS